MRLRVSLQGMVLLHSRTSLRNLACCSALCPTTIFTATSCTSFHSPLYTCAHPQHIPTQPLAMHDSHLRRQQVVQQAGMHACTRALSFKARPQLSSRSMLKQLLCMQQKS